jgi:hypothetical protein
MLENNHSNRFLSTRSSTNFLIRNEQNTRNLASPPPSYDIAIQKKKPETIVVESIVEEVVDPRESPPPPMPSVLPNSTL